MSTTLHSQEKLKIIQSKVQKILILTQELQTELTLCQTENQTLLNTNSTLQQELTIIQQENNDLKQQLLKSQNQTIYNPSLHPNQTSTSDTSSNQPTFSLNINQNHPQIILHPVIIQAMTLLKKYRSDQSKLNIAFTLFKEVADENLDPEACWRTAACYWYGTGVKSDINLALEYSKII
jgi:TPR repeat protein